jgi:hypothetical protein
MNDQVTKPVGKKTIASLIRPEHAGGLLAQPYFFCDAPTCDAVYISALGEHVVTKDQLIVRVGIKETVDPIPLCYCFGYDRKRVRDDIRSRGSTDIQKDVTARVKAGECRCEETNPSGGCCLGTLSRAIKEARAMKAQGLL